MKVNVLIGLGVGCLLIAGGYYAYTCIKNKEQHTEESIDRRKESHEKRDIVTNHMEKECEVSVNNISNDIDDLSVDTMREQLSEAKESVVENISERHKEAADIMKESLNNIKSEVKFTESENSYVLDEMNNQLDDLMS